MTVDNTAVETQSKTTHKPTAQQDQILIICEDDVSHEAISRNFTNAGYPIKIVQNVEEVKELPEMTEIDDLAIFGAIVHVAHSNTQLSQLLGERFEQIKDEEWVLIEGDDEDLHCTVELTVRATATLRSYVHTLWSMFNIA